jgi:hypothetical protein
VNRSEARARRATTGDERCNQSPRTKWVGRQDTNDVDAIASRR